MLLFSYHHMLQKTIVNHIILGCVAKDLQAVKVSYPYRWLENPNSEETNVTCIIIPIAAQEGRTSPVVPYCLYGMIWAVHCTNKLATANFSWFYDQVRMSKLRRSGHIPSSNIRYLKNGREFWFAQLMAHGNM